MTIKKTATLFHLNDEVVALEETSQLGSFVEVRAESEEHLFETLKLIGFSSKDVIVDSYIELMLKKKLPNYLRLLMIYHGKLGEYIFGAVSGVLTTLGLIVGMNTATSSKLSVIAAIAVIAIADSCSDAFGIYMSKMSEGSGGRLRAWRYALGTWIGKVITPLSFVPAIVVFPLQVGVGLDIAWGAVILSCCAAEQAIVAGEKIYKAVLTRVGMATVVIIASQVVGQFIAWAIANVK